MNTQRSLATILLWYLLAASARAELVGYYSFEEGAGNIARDSALVDGTPTPNDDASSFGAASYVAGTVGSYALKINGADGSPIFGNQDMLNGASGVTLAAWVRLDALPVNGDISSVVFLSNGSFHLNARAVLDIDSSGRLEMGGRALDSETFRSRVTSSMIATGIWYHLAGVMDYPNDSVTIYLNGVAQPLLAGSTNFTGTQASNTNSIGASLGSTDRAMEFLKGSLDDVRIYNSALTPAQVAGLIPEPTSITLALAGVSLLASKRLTRRTVS